MELLAVFLVVFLVGVQVGQLIASWAIFYAVTELGRGQTGAMFTGI